MKHTILLLLFMIFSHQTFAQQSLQDVVYLKNGSIIRGMIIEQVPNKSIKIETADKNVFVYQMDEIEKIAKEEAKGKYKSSSNNVGLGKGYQGIIEFGYATKTGGDAGLDFLKLNIINGYCFNPHLALGFGTGARYYFDAESIFVPIFADLRVNFINGNVTPYIAFGGGYSFNASNNFEGVGLMLNPSAGVSIKISEKSAMNVGVGFEMQKINFTFGGYRSSVNLNAISINLGFSF
jgi:hypothetical protein